MKRIPLTRGFFALVDDEDCERLSMFKWHVRIHTTGRKYAGRHAFQMSKDGKLRAFPRLLHHEVLRVESSCRIDHRNNDGLDNRQSNLRRASSFENLMNSRPHRDSSHGFKGVQVCANRYLARIRVDGCRYYLGSYGEPVAAAQAYNFAALKLQGDFAWLNSDSDGNVLKPVKPKIFKREDTHSDQ